MTVKTTIDTTRFITFMKQFNSSPREQRTWLLIKPEKPKIWLIPAQMGNTTMTRHKKTYSQSVAVDSCSFKLRYLHLCIGGIMMPGVLNINSQGDHEMTESFGLHTVLIIIAIVVACLIFLKKINHFFLLHLKTVQAKRIRWSAEQREMYLKFEKHLKSRGKK